MDEALSRIGTGFDLLKEVQGPTNEEKIEQVINRLPEWAVEALRERLCTE